VSIVDAAGIVRAAGAQARPAGFRFAGRRNGLVDVPAANNLSVRAAHGVRVAMGLTAGRWRKRSENSASEVRYDQTPAAAFNPFSTGGGQDRVRRPQLPRPGIIEDCGVEKKSTLCGPHAQFPGFKKRSVPALHLFTGLPDWPLRKLMRQFAQDPGRIQRASGDAWPRPAMTFLKIPQPRAACTRFFREGKKQRGESPDAVPVPTDEFGTPR